MRLRFGVAGLAAQALLLALFSAATPSARAADFVTQSFPVPISVEGERVRSSLLIQFEIQRYGVPFDAFASGNLDSFETAFTDFMQALRAGDAAKVASLQPGAKPEEVREIVGRFREAFAVQQNVKVIGRVRVGEEQVFIWEWPGLKGPVRRGFAVNIPARGSPRVSMVYSALPLETLIVDVMQQEAVRPREYAPVEPRTRYSYAFPPTGLGRPGAHPVVLHFDGAPLDVEMFTADAVRAAASQGDMPVVAAAPTAAYRAAYLALKERDPRRFPESYTEKSREKLQAWLQKMSPEELNSFLATATQPRTLRFLIDADPVVLVFYTVGTEERLRYEYLLKAGDGYKLTNAYYESFLDDVIGNGALFPTELPSFRKDVLASGATR